MNRLKIAAPAIFLLMSCGGAHAASVSDAINDFLPSYTGTHQADLDVKNFSVSYNSDTSLFTIGAQMAGAIDPTLPGFYVVGVNTGTGALAPFGPLGEPNVIFNQAITINKDGTGKLGATVLDPSAISISGDSFSFKIALSLLPSTGFSPTNYGFNLWPRFGSGTQPISDFAPDNATLAASAPEAATWAMMLVGMAAVGSAMRHSRRVRVAFG
jgi:hypothetical protein